MTCQCELTVVECPKIRQSYDLSSGSVISTAEKWVTHLNSYDFIETFFVYIMIKFGTIVIIIVIINTSNSTTKAITTTTRLINLATTIESQYYPSKQQPTTQLDKMAIKDSGKKRGQIPGPKGSTSIRYHSTIPLTIPGLPVLGNLFDLDLDDSLTSLINMGQKYGSSLGHLHTMSQTS
jgi:hypothetical protein